MKRVLSLRTHRTLLPLLLLLTQVVVVAPSHALEPDLRTFKSTVEPILKQYCYECHGPDGEASPRLTLLDPDLYNGVDGESWHDALNRVNEGKMPPKTAQPLPESKRDQLVAWLTGEIKGATVAKRSTGGKVVFRRLTNYEYNNTLRDLLGIQFDYAENLPPESKSVDGFLNNGQVLGISPLQMEYYLAAARSAMSKAIVTGEQPEVHTQVVEKSIKGARDNNVNGQRLDGRQQFLAGITKFPRNGKVRITVQAYAEVPEGKATPELQVNIGIRSDTLSPSAELGVREVHGTELQPQRLVLEGRIESFPLPGKNPKFPGIQIRLKNLTAQPEPAPKKGEPAPPSTEPLIYIQSVTFEGPLYDSWPPEHHTRLLPLEGQGQKGYAEAAIENFMRRAYRRPVTKSELAKVTGFYHSIAATSDSFEEAIRETFALILISPEFLYLVEPVEEEQQVAKLTDDQLAVRLSYFLWSSMPDEELFALADNRQLSKAKVLQQQVDRMLEDERSWQFVQNFTSQWLDLSGLQRIAINPQYYKDFNDRLKEQMAEETIRFVGEILYHDLSAMNLLQSDFVVINQSLAQHYDLPGPTGSEFARVELLGDENRGGLLTQGSFLLINSNGEDSHPIKRAVWILDRLLDDPPAPPPPDVPELDSEKADLASLSIKRQLELHREKSSCNSCHQGIDGWGIPFEHFDAIGKWRDTGLRVVRNKNVQAELDSSSVLPSGKEVSGVAEFQKYLIENESERFARALVKKMTTYALGRTIEFTDEEAISELTKQFIVDDYNMRKLMIGIVHSELFRSK
tara:strand:- start:13920 stop:16313 length:2394 start_codon:yes stop_codon:yes gene_type:complete